MPDCERGDGLRCRACAVRRHCSTTHSNRQTSPDTRRLGRTPAAAFIRPGLSLSGTNSGPGHNRSIAITPFLAFFFLFFIYLFLVLSGSPSFLAVFVPLSRHPRRSRLPVGAADLDDAAGGRADSGRGEGRHGAGEDSPGSRSSS